MLFTVFGLCVLSVGGVASFIRQAQMLQQNSYFAKRYINWLKGEFSIKKILFPFLYLVASAVLLFLEFDIAFLILSVIGTAIKIPYARYKSKTSIKKLNYTMRVKRQFITYILLLAIVTALYGFFKARLIAAAVIVLATVPAISLIMVRFINAPSEKLITRYYINDAKKILKNHKNLKVVGITGSFGKTSTKYILNEMLSVKYNCVFTPGSFNTPLGVVRTVRESIRPETDVFIAEMGAKQVGDIKEICKIAHPTAGIITSVGPQHLDTFKSIENVAKTKFELADSVNAAGGKIFINSDNETSLKKAENYDYISFGASGDVKYENVSYSPSGAEFDIITKDEKIHIKTKLLGLYNVINITAAAALALHLGVKPVDISYAAARLAPVSHRLELKKFIGGSVLLDDAYNANPIGSAEAVNVLSSFDGFKKVIVTPGLVELGEKEYEYNYNLGAHAAEKCDVIILVGEQRAKPMKKAAEDCGFSGTLTVVPSFKDAMTELQKICNKNTAVLFENDLPDNYSK